MEDPTGSRGDIIKEQIRQGNRFVLHDLDIGSIEVSNKWRGGKKERKHVKITLDNFTVFDQLGRYMPRVSGNVYNMNIIKGIKSTEDPMHIVPRYLTCIYSFEKSLGNEANICSFANEGFVKDYIKLYQEFYEIDEDFDRFIADFNIKYSRHERYGQNLMRAINYMMEYNELKFIDLYRQKATIKRIPFDTKRINDKIESNGIMGPITMERGVYKDNYGKTFSIFFEDGVIPDWYKHIEYDQNQLTLRFKEKIDEKAKIDVLRFEGMNNLLEPLTSVVKGIDIEYVPPKDDTEVLPDPEPLPPPIIPQPQPKPEPTPQPTPKPKTNSDPMNNIISLDECHTVAKYILTSGHSKITFDGKDYEYLVPILHVNKLQKNIKSTYGEINQYLSERINFTDTSVYPWEEYSVEKEYESKIPNGEYIPKIFKNLWYPNDCPLRDKNNINYNYESGYYSSFQNFGINFKSTDDGKHTVPSVFIISIPPLKRNNGDIVKPTDFPLLSFASNCGFDTTDYDKFIKNSDSYSYYNESGKIHYPNTILLVSFTIFIERYTDSNTSPSGTVHYKNIRNDINSAVAFFDTEDKLYASKEQIIYNFAELEKYGKYYGVKSARRIEMHIQDAFCSHFPIMQMAPKFIPGVPGSDGTHPLDIPLEGHPIYIKAWTGSK